MNTGIATDLLQSIATIGDCLLLLIDIRKLLDCPAFGLRAG